MDHDLVALLLPLLLLLLVVLLLVQVVVLALSILLIVVGIASIAWRSASRRHYADEWMMREWRSWRVVVSKHARGRSERW